MKSHLIAKKKKQKEACFSVYVHRILSLHVSMLFDSPCLFKDPPTPNTQSPLIGQLSQDEPQRSNNNNRAAELDQFYQTSHKAYMHYADV